MARAVAKLCLSDQLREIIASRGTAYAAAKSAGVDPGVVHRFVTGERGLTLGTLDRLAESLGLRLIEVGGRPKRPAVARGRTPARRVAAASPVGPGPDDDQGDDRSEGV